ncbi:class I SAM-dependent methyltransferase [Candidatus Margulisiibacteriota bacterium]
MKCKTIFTNNYNTSSYNKKITAKLKKTISEGLDILITSLNEYIKNNTVGLSIFKNAKTYENKEYFQSKINKSLKNTDKNNPLYKLLHNNKKTIVEALYTHKKLQTILSEKIVGNIYAELIPLIEKKKCSQEAFIFALYCIENISKEDPIASFIKSAYLLFYKKRNIKKLIHLKSLEPHFSKYITFLSKLMYNYDNSFPAKIKNNIDKKVDFIHNKNKKQIIRNLKRKKISFGQALQQFPDTTFWDKYLKINTMGPLLVKKRVDTKHGDASPPIPSLPEYLGKIIETLLLTEEDVVDDLGGGSGRAACYFATEKVKKINLIELDEAEIKKARTNTANNKLKMSPIEITKIDIAEYQPKEGTVFFMYNPCGEKTLIDFLDNLEKELDGRKRRIAYLSPHLASVINERPWLKLTHKICNNNVFIWEYNPSSKSQSLKKAS